MFQVNNTVQDVEAALTWSAYLPSSWMEHVQMRQHGGPTLPSSFHLDPYWLQHYRPCSPENAELKLAKIWKEQYGVTAILLRDALIRDKEDMEYAQYVLDGMTKKKSSTFNMSGLTGSTNGHFGGVASSSRLEKTWLRRRKRAASEEDSWWQ